MSTDFQARQMRQPRLAFWHSSGLSCSASLGRRSQTETIQLSPAAKMSLLSSNRTEHAPLQYSIHIRRCWTYNEMSGRLHVQHSNTSLLPVSLERRFTVALLLSGIAVRAESGFSLLPLPPGPVKAACSALLLRLLSSSTPESDPPFFPMPWFLKLLLLELCSKLAAVFFCDLGTSCNAT